MRKVSSYYFLQSTNTARVGSDASNTMTYSALASFASVIRSGKPRQTPAALLRPGARPLRAEFLSSGAAKAQPNLDLVSQNAVSDPSRFVRTNLLHVRQSGSQECQTPAFCSNLI